MKRAIIVHQWSGSPSSDWYPWLKSELEKLGFSVVVPAMPRPDAPNIIDWTQALDAAVGLPDPQTILIGHSVGCQTILRYVSRLPGTMRLGGAVLVTPWIHLSPAALETEADQLTAKTWLETPIEWTAAKNILPKVVACFSDDDPYVPATDASIFKDYLGAEIVELGKMGHLTGAEGYTKVPEILALIKKSWAK